MQKILVVVLGFGLVVANARADVVSGANPVDQMLPKMIAEVTACAVLPYTVNSDGQQTNHALMSHCEAVKIVQPGVAEIKVEAHIFRASLQASVDSDGDLYQVTFQDLQTGSVQTYGSVAAYGDILLGVLGGDASHVFQQHVSDQTALNADANLLH